MPNTTQSTAPDTRGRSAGAVGQMPISRINGSDELVNGLFELINSSHAPFIGQICATLDR